MGNIGKSIKKVVSPIANIASFIPGPHQGIAQAISGVGSLLEQKDAAARQEQLGEQTLSQVRGGSEFASGVANKQLELAENLGPLIQALQSGGLQLTDPIVRSAIASYDSARQYDPGVETEQLTRLYDTSLADTLKSDLGKTRMPFSMRGFTGGSTDKVAATGNLLYNRARGRADFTTNLKLGERERKEQATGNAFNRLTSALGSVNPVGNTGAVSNMYGSAAGTRMGSTGTNLNLANVRLGQANQYDPSAAIGQIAAGMKNIKFPW